MPLIDYGIGNLMLRYELHDGCCRDNRGVQIEIHGALGAAPRPPVRRRRCPDCGVMAARAPTALASFMLLRPIRHITARVYCIMVHCVVQLLAYCICYILGVAATSCVGRAWLWLEETRDQLLLLSLVQC